MEDLLGKGLDVTLDVVAVIIHDHDVYAEVILFGNLLRPVAKLLLFAGGEDVCRVGYIVDPGLGKGAGGETEQQREQEQQGDRYFFHGTPPPHRKYISTASAMATPPAIPANHSRLRQFETGRSPMSLPVWPFMAKR